jgi:hypothetical protein
MFTPERLRDLPRDCRALAQLRLAVYKTRGGKYITSLSKTQAIPGLVNAFQTAEDAEGPDNGYNTAAVHETFEDAMNWRRHHEIKTKNFWILWSYPEPATGNFARGVADEVQRAAWTDFDVGPSCVHGGDLLSYCCAVR